MKIKLNSFHVLPIVLAFIFICGLIGCMTDKRIQKICATCPGTTKDSVYTIIKNVPFDTAFFLSGYDGKEIILPSKCGDLCDSLEHLMERYNNNYQVKANGVKTTIKKDLKGYKINSNVDSLLYKITLLQKQIETNRLTKKDRIVYIDRPVLVDCKLKHVNAWHKFTSIFFLVFIVAIASRIFLKFYAFRKR